MGRRDGLARHGHRHIAEECRVPAPKGIRCGSGRPERRFPLRARNVQLRHLHRGRRASGPGGARLPRDLACPRPGGEGSLHDTEQCILSKAPEGAQGSRSRRRRVPFPVLGEGADWKEMGRGRPPVDGDSELRVPSVRRHADPLQGEDREEAGLSRSANGGKRSSRTGSSGCWRRRPDGNSMGIVISCFAKAGGTGISNVLFHTARAAYRTGDLDAVICYGNRQSEIPAKPASAPSGSSPSGWSRS